MHPKQGVEGLNRLATEKINYILQKVEKDPVWTEPRSEISSWISFGSISITPNIILVEIRGYVFGKISEGEILHALRALYLLDLKTSLDEFESCLAIYKEKNSREIVTKTLPEINKLKEYCLPEKKVKQDTEIQKFKPTNWFKRLISWFTNRRQKFPKATALP